MKSSTGDLYREFLQGRTESQKEERGYITVTQMEIFHTKKLSRCCRVATRGLGGAVLTHCPRTRVVKRQRYGKMCCWY